MKMAIAWNWMNWTIHSSHPQSPRAIRLRRPKAQSANDELCYPPQRPMTESTNPRRAAVSRFFPNELPSLIEPLKTKRMSSLRRRKLHDTEMLYLRKFLSLLAIVLSLLERLRHLECPGHLRLRAIYPPYTTMRGSFSSEVQSPDGLLDATRKGTSSTPSFRKVLD